MIVCGCVIKYVLGDILRSDVVDLVSKSAFALFVKNTPVPSSIDFGPFTDTIGIVLIVLGAFLLVLSLIGCCAVCCSFRILLLLVSDDEQEDSYERQGYRELYLAVTLKTNVHNNGDALKNMYCPSLCHFCWHFSVFFP